MSDDARRALAHELARAGLVRTDAEITRMLTERDALEQAVARQRAPLDPRLGLDAFAERLRAPGAR
jgi:hypothetical protein